MAGPRGYHNYRGRTSKGKIALTVLLVLVILIAVVVMLLQRNIVYDETGTPHLELPWQEETPAEEAELPDVSGLDITVEESGTEAVTPESIRGFAVPTGVLTRESWETAQTAATSCTAVAVTLKDDSGKVYFDTAAAVSGSVKIEADTAEVLTELTGEDSAYYTIACISCFHDPKAANSDVEGMGLKNTGGYIFYDGDNSQWLDPGKAAARKYLCELAREAAELGFDEILLTDVSYPTEGKLDKISYGTGGKAEHLTAFLAEMRAALEPYSVALSVEVPESVLSTGRDDTVGLTLDGVAAVADRIYAAMVPENAETYAAAIRAINDAATLVVELEAEEPTFAGSCLIFG